MKTTKRERMYLRIKEHGENLNVIFGMDEDPIKLCKRLRRVETMASMYNERSCNGEVDEEESMKLSENIIRRLTKIIGECNMAKVYINRDPRGYALKINDNLAKDMVIHRDMGGYGIVAPEFDGEL